MKALVTRQVQFMRNIDSLNTLKFGKALEESITEAYHDPEKAELGFQIVDPKARNGIEIWMNGISHFATGVADYYGLAYDVKEGSVCLNPFTGETYSLHTDRIALPYSAENHTMDILIGFHDPDNNIDEIYYFKSLMPRRIGWSEGRPSQPITFSYKEVIKFSEMMNGRALDAGALNDWWNILVGVKNNGEN